MRYLTTDEIKRLIRDEINTHGYFCNASIRPVSIMPVELEMEYETRGWEIPRDLNLNKFKEKLNV